MMMKTTGAHSVIKQERTPRAPRSPRTIEREEAEKQERIRLHDERTAIAQEEKAIKVADKRKLADIKHKQQMKALHKLDTCAVDVHVDFAVLEQLVAKQFSRHGAIDAVSWNKFDTKFQVTFKKPQSARSMVASGPDVDLPSLPGKGKISQRMIRACCVHFPSPMTVDTGSGPPTVEPLTQSFMGECKQVLRKFGPVKRIMEFKGAVVVEFSTPAQAAAALRTSENIPDSIVVGGHVLGPFFHSVPKRNITKRLRSISAIEEEHENRKRQKFEAREAREQELEKRRAEKALLKAQHVAENTKENGEKAPMRTE